MNKNTGNADRAVRVSVAVVAVVAAALLGFGSWGSIVLLVVAAVLLVTAAVGFCPLYRVFGINTCKVAPADKKVAVQQ